MRIIEIVVVLMLVIQPSEIMLMFPTICTTKTTAFTKYGIG